MKSHYRVPKTHVPSATYIRAVAPSYFANERFWRRVQQVGATPSNLSRSGGNRMEWTARIRFTARQRDELWEWWKNGQCVADIARALGRRNKSGVYRILAHDGGIVPLPRLRAAAALRLEER